MKDLKLFEREFNLIQDMDLQIVVKSYFEEKVPLYFWFDGASSSGKFHPKFSQGEGGLVRHTKAVVAFAEELLQLPPYCDLTDEEKDCVIVACLVHDTIKYGDADIMNQAKYKSHAENGAKTFQEYATIICGYDVNYLIIQAITSHMGKWGKIKPSNDIDSCVHLADYIASRSFIDIPDIINEYAEIGKKYEIGEVIFYYGSEGEPE